MNEMIQSNEIERVAQRRAELRIGLLLQAEWGSFAAIEHLSEARFQALQSNSDLFVVLSRQRALDLQFSHDPSRPAVLRLPKDYRFGNLKSLADPALDLDYPGKGPLAQGELEVEYCDLMLEFCRQSRTLPAVIFTRESFEGTPKILPKDWEIIQEPAPVIERVANARVPLKWAQSSQFHVFRDTHNDSEHYAIIIGGTLDPTPVVRLHSACFTGDCLGSLKCDCGPQLETAIKTINQTGGVLLYLSQEGRGIGLTNKIRAYHLQDQGFDTVDANLRLGFRDDERDFRVGAEILKSLRISQVELMTNNPRKVEWLERSGIKVAKRIPIQIEPNRENRDYLQTKSTKSGHLL